MNPPLDAQLDPQLHARVKADFAAHEAKLIELHRRLVAIPTVNHGDGAPADEKKLAIFAAGWLHAEAGIQARLAEGVPERANLLATIGAGPRRVLWMSHSDVVPPGDVAAWSHPPFSGALDGGRIWGRGSNDCKMLVAAQIFALARLKALGLPLGGEIALAVGAGEENGGNDGFGHLAREHADFLRADMAICEGGGSCLGTFNGRPVISLSTGDKGKYTVVFRAVSEGGHACSPWGKVNPVALIGKLLDRLETLEHPVRVDAPGFAQAARWAGMNGGGPTPANLEELLARLAKLSDSVARSLRGQSRNTFTPTMMQAGVTSNVIPNEATLACDVRILPGEGAEQVEALARQLVEGLESVTFKLEAPCPPSVSPIDEPLRLLFERAASEALDTDVEVAPVWCVGATDARYVRRLGTPVYGFQVVHPEADPARLGIHCVDESIEARMLLPCATAIALATLDFMAV